MVYVVILLAIVSVQRTNTLSCMASIPCTAICLLSTGENVHFPANGKVKLGKPGMPQCQLADDVKEKQT